MTSRRVQRILKSRSNVHIASWEDYKRIATKVKPKAILYTTQRSPLTKPPLGLRLIFADSESEYIFLDFAQGNVLKKTGIPVKFTSGGEPYLDDGCVKRFLVAQLGRPDIQVISLEVMGY